MRQSKSVKATLQALHPDLRIELQVIKTIGDKILDVPLAKVGGKGLFVKEIEDALLDRSVDLAVHSMKDVPSELPTGLLIGAIPQREDPRDVLVSRHGAGLAELPPEAVVGTSSLRRAAQLKRLRPDLEIQNLRGNLDTRLRKVRDGAYEAIVLAAAGLHRMGWEEHITAYFDPAEFLPAVGQGAIGIEIRSDDESLHQLLRDLHHPATALAVKAERSFLQELEGGCQVPIGGYARIMGESVELTGLVCSLDGREMHRITRTARLEMAASLGIDLAREILEAGAGRILDDVYRAGGCRAEQ